MEDSEESGVMSAVGTVVVVGAVNVDLVVNAPRLPGPGETVVGSGLRTFGGGKGANAAVAAARAGARVHLVAAVGADDHGGAALAELAADGVDVTSVAILEDQPTGVALIVVDDQGENQIALGPGANGALGAGQVSAALAALLPTADCVLVSAEIPLEAVGAALREARAAGVHCILNPAPVIDGLEGLVPLGAILTPNESELAQLVGRTGQASMAAMLTELVQRSGASAIVTLGGDGCVVASPGGTPAVFPARPARVVDTTGAGDTFNGVLAARLAAGGGLVAAVDTAMIAAAISVGAHGARTGMPTAAEIQAARS